MTAFTVWGKGFYGNYKVIDTVYFVDSFTTEEVKDSLVHHDKYDDDIIVERE